MKRKKKKMRKNNNNNKRKTKKTNRKNRNQPLRRIIMKNLNEEEIVHRKGHREKLNAILRLLDQKVNENENPLKVAVNTVRRKLNEIPKILSYKKSNDLKKSSEAVVSLSLDSIRICPLIEPFEN
jgi:hypothetical protein